MIIVGFGHRFGVGKDAAARVLVEQYGFVRRAFADALKEEVLDRFPGLLDEICKVTPNAIMGADAAENRRRLVWWLKPPLVRALLQHYGTDVRRRDTDGLYWIEKMEEYIDTTRPERLVITDVRFSNEVEWVTMAAGFLDSQGYAIRVDRDQAPRTSASAHASETEAADAPWDFVIGNHGDSLTELEARVHEAMAVIGVARP